MKAKTKTLIISIAIPLAVGGLSALLTKDSMVVFDYVTKPPLSPPAWLFPVVWTILYVLMGLSSYFVYTSDKPKEDINTALLFYGIQLFFNFFWSIFFFNMEKYLFSLVWLIAMWVLIIITTLKFYRIDRKAGYLMLPYLLWVTFAAYLNWGIYVLNKRVFRLARRIIG